VDPLNAEFVHFLAHYSREKMVAITPGLEPVESGCFRLWNLVFHQEGRRRILTGKESPELTKAQAAIAGLLAGITSEHPREKTPEPIKWRPRTVVSPTEIMDVMEVVMLGRYKRLSPDIEGLRRNRCID
jgi:hypothetical protein